MIDFDKGRRRFVTAAGMGGAGLMLAGTNPRIVRAAERDGEDKEKEVSAVEDLMREHGVIRRAILVYREAAVKLRAKPTDVDPDVLRRTALLFRSFGEDYHEKNSKRRTSSRRSRRPAGRRWPISIFLSLNTTWSGDHRLRAHGDHQGSDWNRRR